VIDAACELAHLAAGKLSKLHFEGDGAKNSLLRRDNYDEAICSCYHHIRS
jgi:hypothetical protein